MSKTKYILAIFASLFVMMLAEPAFATHFRYGNITYTIPDPINAPTTVRFDVVTAWRKTFIGSTTLNFGDGQSNPDTQGFKIGEGTDAAGEAYEVRRYVVTHQYATKTVFTAFFTSCCRISNLINAGDDSFRVEAIVDLTSGNTGNAVSALPAIIQLPIGTTPQIAIPAVDPDNVPVHCRFGNSAESLITVTPAVIPGGGAPTLTDTPTGCTFTWNTAAGAAGQQFAVNIVLESFNGPTKATAMLDFIIEFVSGGVPTCAGGGIFDVDMGETLNINMTGTNPGGGNLKMTNIGTYGVLNPGPGNTQASPFAVNYQVSPAPGDQGVQIMTILFTNAANIGAFCSVAVNVANCPQFGQPCTAGIGTCEAIGYKLCDGGVEVCSATPGMPTAELCDGLDNNCDGVIDDGNPQTGDPCTTGLSGICSQGTYLCNSGLLSCLPNVIPGAVSETCDGVDQDCDGVVDDGFGTGAMCVEGNGLCTAAGIIVCDGIGGTTCNADPGIPTTETCNGKDDDCDLQIDEDFPLGDACTSGIGACAKAGVLVCDGAGGTTCGAVPGSPTTEECGNDADEDCDGALDNGCPDTDADGLLDAIEVAYGLDPNDADSDDDGAPDGDEPSWNTDSDGDGLINALDFDSDNDALADGTELGLGCGGPGTNAAAGHCVADADPATTTDPLNPDSDGGSSSDGSEDNNLNGKVDAGETSPGASGDDATTADTDGDGLGDALEATLGTDPDDADTDDDGLLDGNEANPTADTDGDGLTNPLDVDSDNDGLFDGLESGLACGNPGTEGNKHCKSDGDPTTKTGVLTADSDGGGVIDGSEDTNLNGVVGASDTDPLDKSDDATIKDTDLDGLSDALEESLGSSPTDKDSDDDGVLDGDEANPSDDADGDDVKNIIDHDSDGDGIFDGTELGLDCSHPNTDVSAGHCVPDADPTTKTNPLLEDTDHGGIADGDEDVNHNGAIDAGDTDPNDATDDVPPECTTDADCGAVDSGKICDEGACIAGCRGANGNGCPANQVCSSNDEAPGTCEDGAGGAGGEGGGDPIPGAGGGCGCRVAGDGTQDGMPAALLAIGVLGIWIARRRRAA